MGMVCLFGLIDCKRPAVLHVVEFPLGSLVNSKCVTFGLDSLQDQIGRLDRVRFDCPLAAKIIFDAVKQIVAYILTAADRQDVLGKNPATTVVVIDEVDTDNWGIAGEQVTVRRKRGE